MHRFLKTRSAAIGVCLALLLATADAVASAGPATLPAARFDFSVTTSAALTARAWDALAARDFEAVVAYTEKCRDLYEAEARRQQATLTAIIPAAEREKIFSLSALNDVAVCYLIAAQGRELLGQTSAAIGLYRALSERFSYAQCWDTKGWFWRPAAEGRTRLFHLEFEAASR